MSSTPIPARTPVFQQVGSLPLYSLSSSGDAGLGGYWAGFLPGSSIGSQLSLEQAWNDLTGMYLFLQQTPSDPAQFLASLRTMLPKISPTGLTRFLWMPIPNAPISSWQWTTLLARGTAGFPAQWSVARAAIFPLGDYSVQVRAGAGLTLPSGATLPGIAIADGALSFVATAGVFPALAASAFLPLAGASVGAFTAAFACPAGADAFAQLGTGLRYAMPSTEPDSNAVQPLHMPVLAQGPAAMQLLLSFDPLNPLAGSRSGVRFFGTGQPSAWPALPCALKTNLGYGTTLTPAIPTTATPARLTFCFSPLYTNGGEAFRQYYLCPDGAFGIASLNPHVPASGIADRVLLGLSGMEYAALDAASGDLLLFEAGQPAYAPLSAGATPEASLTTPLPIEDQPLLTPAGTTSYITMVSATNVDTGLLYFAQPVDAPLYAAGGALGTGFLRFLEIPADRMPVSGPSPCVSVPAAWYSTIDPALTPYARTLEHAVLAPARRTLMGIPFTPTLALGAGVDTPPLAVTPQGLVVELSQNALELEGLVVARMHDGSTVAFTEVGPAFQGALQSPQLFCVVSNAAEFMRSSSVPYQLTAAQLPLLTAAGVPAATVQQISAALAAQQPPFPPFVTEQAFVAVVGASAGSYLPQVLAVAGRLKVSLEGWVFQLSPRSWRSTAADPTVMIFKYCNRSLADIVNAPASWCWPEASMDGQGSQSATVSLLQAFCLEAQSAAEGTPYQRFYRDVLANPLWNGVLFLNAPVSLEELPAEMQFLTAGINVDRFYAHHIGFSLTPFASVQNEIELGETAVFALIEYTDTTDLVMESSVPFAFKTTLLTAAFQNAQLSGFSAEVELMVNRLFGSALTKLNTDRGNNLRLLGSFQRQSNGLAYSFALQDSNVFAAPYAALDSVEVLGVQLQTTSSAALDAPMAATFLLSGNLRFTEWPDFDLFSFGRQQFWPEGTTPADGYLRFAGLPVEMSFTRANPRQQTFAVRESQAGFDLSNSRTRPLSLVGNFPLRLSGLVASPNFAAPGEAPKGQRPEDLGYASITAPLDQALLSPPWFGLVFTLELGSLGALAGSVGLSIQVLMAWAEGAADGDRPVYLGLQVPDASSAALSLPIQGVLRLGFRGFSFQVNEVNGRLAYVLRMRRLALSILGWSFPPGNADVFLFGNPEGDASASLGWYAAYAGLPDSSPKGARTGPADLCGEPFVPPSAARALASNSAVARQRRLQSGRRGPPGFDALSR